MLFRHRFFVRRSHPSRKSSLCLRPPTLHLTHPSSRASSSSAAPSSSPPATSSPAPSDSASPSCMRSSSASDSRLVRTCMRASQSRALLDQRIIRVRTVMTRMDRGGRGRRRGYGVSVPFGSRIVEREYLLFNAAFLTVPMFSLFLTLRNQASYKRKELVRNIRLYRAFTIY